jgi:hypothetical protein
MKVKDLAQAGIVHKAIKVVMVLMLVVTQLAAAAAVAQEELAQTQ